MDAQAASPTHICVTCKQVKQKGEFYQRTPRSRLSRPTIMHECKTCQVRRAMVNRREKQAK